MHVNQKFVATNAGQATLRFMEGYSRVRHVPVGVKYELVVATLVVLNRGEGRWYLVESSQKTLETRQCNNCSGWQRAHGTYPCFS